MSRPAVLAVLAVFCAAPSAADVVVLPNGVSLSGLVRASTEAELTLQVSEDGFVILGAEEVLKVERQGPGENERLRASWAGLARQAKELERREFEEERLAGERREKRRAAERDAPPPLPAQVSVHVVVYQQVFAPPQFVVATAPFERRRRRIARGPIAPEPARATTSSGLLPPPWSFAREIPLILGPSLGPSRL